MEQKCVTPKSADIGQIIRTYLLQFIYKNGNGWAIVNASTPNLAESIFKNQTKYEEARVTNIKECKWFGDNTQLVYEGAVTTFTNVDVDLARMINIDDLYKKIDTKINEAISAIIEDSSLLSNYITKSEASKLIAEEISNIELPEIDLSEYATRLQLETVVRLLNQNIHNIQLKPGPQGPQGEQGLQGAAGVGISDINYNSGTLTIVLTDGTNYSFEISSGDGPSPQPAPSIEEVTTLRRGTFQKALQYAREDSDRMFQWILEQPISDGTIRKVIWHVGNQVFIDALGSVISDS